MGEEREGKRDEDKMIGKGRGGEKNRSEGRKGTDEEEMRMIEKKIEE